MGNLLSVARAFEYNGASVKLSDKPAEILGSDRVVLPGVGAFGDCMNEMTERGLIDTIKRYVGLNRPLLGICVGMQALLNESKEYGMHKGLSVIDGKVIAIPNTDINGNRHNIPHIGWTPVKPPDNENQSGIWSEDILKGIEYGTSMYFVHSYMAVPEHDDNRLADSYYNGCKISAAITSGYVRGLQFHPEKSGVYGLKVLENFLDL